MSQDGLEAQLSALLQRLQGLESHVSQIREVLGQQARFYRELSEGPQELLPQIGALLQQMAWKGESVATLTPAIVESARGQCREKDIVAGHREIRATGGLEFGDFLHELEQAAGPDE
jgi:hypothetical protein